MSILNEKSRNELISKSKSGEREKDGQTRYEKRLKSKIGTSVQQYNRMDMNKLFKEDILNIAIDVHGETDNYIVKISWGGLITALQEEIKRNNNKLELRNIIKSLVISFNKDDVYVKCTCEDFKYRFHYWATIDKYNEGEPELRPTDETNPDNKLGSACKHVLLILSNTSWIIKVASVINNYIKYMEIHQKRLYQKIIYPKLYNKEYEEETQLDISDISQEDELSSDSDIIDKSNIEARKRGQFISGNKYRIQPNTKLKDQQSLFDDDEEEQIEDDK